MFWSDIVSTAGCKAVIQTSLCIDAVLILRKGTYQHVSSPIGIYERYGINTSHVTVRVNACECESREAPDPQAGCDAAVTDRACTETLTQDTPYLGVRVHPEEERKIRISVEVLVFI